MEYRGFEVLKDTFEDRSIPEDIVKDKYYKIFTRKQEEILKFVKDQLIDQDRRSPQDYFECVVLEAILYWRKKISREDFKSYVLSKQNMYSQFWFFLSNFVANHDNKCSFFSWNLAFHPASAGLNATFTQQANI